jgi:hypothetical protein
MLTNIALYIENYCNTEICKMPRLHISNVVLGTYRITDNILNKLLVIFCLMKNILLARQF